MRRQRGLVLALGLVLIPIGATACAPLAAHAVVSVDEYAAYRRFRMAETVEAKLAAGYAYLRARPRGSYAREVGAWFRPAAGAYVKSSWESRSRLVAFLEAVPVGPDADRAAARLVELELSDELRAASEQAFAAKLRAMDDRLTQADRGRRRLISEVIGWVRRLVALRTWGGRTSELPHDLIHAYRLTPPEARCSDTACSKTLLIGYSVPEGKVQSAREALVDVGLELERGGVVRAAIAGPELFTRLGEALRVAAVPTGDWLGRAEAIGQTAQLVALGVEPLMPASRCAAEAVSPVVLRRVCDGIELRVVSAVELGEDDRIAIFPVAPAATPPAAAAPRGPTGSGGMQP